jgi:hypothetical protein
MLARQPVSKIIGRQRCWIRYAQVLCLPLGRLQGRECSPRGLGVWAPLSDDSVTPMLPVRFPDEYPRRDFGFLGSVGATCPENLHDNGSRCALGV